VKRYVVLVTLHDVYMFDDVHVNVLNVLTNNMLYLYRRPSRKQSSQPIQPMISSEKKMYPLVPMQVLLLLKKSCRIARVDTFGLWIRLMVL
jgi:hypothetical protein